MNVLIYNDTTADWLYPVGMTQVQTKFGAGAANLGELIDRLTTEARRQFNSRAIPRVVVSPYRFNPLGAHIDHQGGVVLARTLNQYSVGAFYPSNDLSVALVSLSFDTEIFRFQLGDSPVGENWQRYAMASALVFDRWAKAAGVTPTGYQFVVDGTMVGAGLSSSASIILAYLVALADVNQVKLSERELVELTRQVENEHMGLNNGVQDQMSVVFGQRNALSLLNVDAVDVQYWQDPVNVSSVNWLVCYSGFSRELISSGFNDRVSECQQAAALLHPAAQRLGDVPKEKRTRANLEVLPDHLGRRAKHVYSEMQRVLEAQLLWESGDWVSFGESMNASCLSSIQDYECGSEPMHYLHTISLTTYGVYGSRFSGGGYGGCLIMLVDAEFVDSAGESILTAFLERYPEKASVARIFAAQAEDAVRVL